MKKKKVIVAIIIMLIFLWIFGIYKLSSENLTNSNSQSSRIIESFIENTLGLTNKYGITDSHPNETKIEKASQLLNTPLRKVMHASVYFVLAFLIILVTNYLFNNKKLLISVIITIVLVIIAAGFDEYHQTFVGRNGSVKDVLIDTAGGAAGILFYGTYYFAYTIGYKKCLKEETVNNEQKEIKKKA